MSSLEPKVEVTELPASGISNHTIDHLSYSSFLLFLHNRAAWHSKYVLGIRDQQTTPAALTGTAFHKYMELRMKGHTAETAMKTADQVLKSVTDVDWGKTGSLEKCQRDLTLLAGHMEHEWAWDRMNTIGVEMGITEKIKGIKLPILSYIDYIYQDEAGRIRLVDWKSVSSYDDEPTPSHIIQAMFYGWVTETRFGCKPLDFSVVQVKASMNSDKTPQVKPLCITYSEHPEYAKGVKHLVKQAVREMNRKNQPFLVNPRDDYEGSKEFKRFLTNFIEH